MNDRYPFTLIKEEIARRQGRAIDFAVGAPALPMSEDFGHWLHEHVDLATIPCTPADIRAFSADAVAFLSSRYGVELEPEQILPTGGGRAAMAVLAACTVSQGDTVVVTEPGYPAFARLAAQRNANVIASALDPDNDFAPDFSYSPATPRGSVTMIAVNYPNNPTGSTLSDTVLGKLHELAVEKLILFNDATYAPLVYGEAPRCLLGETFAKGRQPEVVELHSFSKLYPIGPLAVAFLAGPRDRLASLAAYSEFAWSPLSRLQLAATSWCLQDTERLQRICELVPPRLDALKDVLETLGFRTHSARSGTYLVCDAPSEIGGVTVASAHEAARQLMERFDIAVVPLGNERRSYLRFTALYRAQDLERLADVGSALRVR